jgi:hypothetical protein
MTNTFATSSVVTEASGCKRVVSLVQSVAPWVAGGGGVGPLPPSVSPPSAQPTTAIDNTSRKVPTNRLKFVILSFLDKLAIAEIRASAIAVVD